MPRGRSPNRDKAFEIYKKHKGNIKLIDIAKELGVSDVQIRYWKNQDKWDNKLNNNVIKPNNNVINKNKDTEPQRKRSGNHNPKNQFTKRNKEAETHGFFSKIFPPEVLDIVEDILIKDPLDILWENIMIQYAAIARSQMIMHVTDKEEMIKELKKSRIKSNEKTTEEEYEYEFQFAWDRQATFLNAQSRAMSELRSMIKQYDELLKTGLATEEQKLRIRKLKVDIEKINRDNLDEDIEYIIEDGETDAEENKT